MPRLIFVYQSKYLKNNISFVIADNPNIRDIVFSILFYSLLILTQLYLSLASPLFLKEL